MSLVYAAVRDPGDAISHAERVIYASFISHIDRRTSVERAILRAARDCGVSRQRALEVIRAVNKEAQP